MNRTTYCKKCYKDKNYESFHSFFNSEFAICNKCLIKMNPIFYNFKFHGVKGLAIYEYNQELKSLIYLLKGCNDFEIRDVLIKPYKIEINNLYRNYSIIPIPSFKDNDALRGYNHVEALFEVLKLPMIKCLEKIENISQHNLNFYDRHKTKKIFKIDEKIDLSQKKILLVDDIMTTGETLKNCLELIKTKNPKEIRILVLAKRFLKK